MHGRPCRFFFLFMAFNTAQQLETTVVPADQHQMVYVSLGVLYAVFTVAAIVAPKVVGFLGPRISMMLGAVPYVLLVFANMKPCYELFVPAFFAVGLGKCTATVHVAATFQPAHAAVHSRKPGITLCYHRAILWMDAGAAILWTGQGIFLSRMAIREAEQLHEPVEAVTSRMNALFFTAFQVCSTVVWRYLLVAFVISPAAVFVSRFQRARLTPSQCRY